MAGKFALPRVLEFDTSGNLLSGGKLYFYSSGTSNPLDTYSDDALTTEHTNPVIASSAGRFPAIFLKNEDYKVVLKTSAGVELWSDDPVRAPSPKSTAVLAKSTTYIVTVGDDGKLIRADATLGAFTVTLPAAAIAGDGFEIAVIKVDATANAVTVDGDGSETINGETEVSLAAQFDACVLRSNGTTWNALVVPLSITTPLPTGYYQGLELSNDAIDTDHDIEIAAGTARDDGDDVNMVVASAFTKRIDAAWAVGDANGGIDTGTVAASTLYYVWLIRRSDTGVVDALFSLSASAPTMPTDYDQKRRIGFVRTNASSNIIQFSFIKDTYIWNESIATTSETTKTILNIPPDTRRIVLVGNGVSATGTDGKKILIGDAGGLEGASYSGLFARGPVNTGTGDPVTGSFSAAFTIQEAGTAAEGTYFTAILTLLDESTNLWNFTLTGNESTSGAGFLIANGTKALSAELTQVSLQVTGTDTFDAGSLRYQFDGYPDPRSLP